ncbi:Tox-REase-5 domain-containing protein [Mycobacterium haemophilum]|uniref:Tox-REase-5 domain-containing protein n=1 Tax=Mycobacterium haemophilum TaxID=29311 RepID=A0A0I9ZRC8_9MYCO|nr:Tox-REase-5 domain-containing protein [Mycobacterium haemophilum]KLO32500.1 hypothetical protein ABH39_05205 [Mycobacterium haemophilum]KLO36761.1 hypothetical protein ABH38_10050 [Mycobacterium haemophilum]KLO42780.1 hypothetical protein ABH37_08675 [Mycobacterium haemophilum]KLO55847.1 hypothetical protein ABH36_05770 [Mycobacterium haemophilum]
MSERAAQYQTQITGHPARTEAYRVDGVDFDGFKDGALIEVKSYYSNLIENGQWKWFFSKQQNLIDQAKNQVRVAKGTPVRWVFAEAETMALMKKMFDDAGLEGMIGYVVVPPQ